MATKKKKFRKPVKKKFEGNFDEDSLSKDHSAKNELDEIYNHIADGTWIRSKCDWYELGKNFKFCFWI